MKYILLAFVCTFSIQFGDCQLSVEDAKGQSSIIYWSSAISFDIGQSNLTAGWNNFRTLSLLKRSAWIWGISASSKNKDGLADFLDKGNFNADSRLNAFVGFRLNTNPNQFLLQKKDEELKSDPRYTNYTTVLTYTKAMDDLISNTDKLSSNTSRSEVKSDFSKTITGDIDKDIPALTKIADGYKINGAKGEQEAAMRMIIDSLEFRKANSLLLEPEYTKVKRDFESLEDQIINLRSKKKSGSWTIYLTGGLNANDLTIYDSSVVTTFAARFDTANFRGANIGIGINWDKGPRWTLGASGGYERANNIDSLETTSYSLKTALTQGGQSFSSEAKYTAYPAPYIKYNRINLKTDFLYFGKLNESFRFVWNTLYTRMYFPHKEVKINSVVDIGTGFNFYKSEGKFVGGIYLQSNDIFDNMGSGNNFGKRLSFGIVAKFSFTSIMERV